MIDFRQLPVGVIQICVMQPDSLMSAIVKVVCAWMRTDGEIFHPRPSSLAACAPVPCVAAAALPFSPVGFSGVTARDFASDRRAMSVMLPIPIGAGCAKVEVVIAIPRRSFGKRFIIFLLPRSMDWKAVLHSY